MTEFVTLEWYEVAMASHVGYLRQMLSLKRGRQDQHGYDGEDGWETHIEGAAGEVAVAKALGLYWSGSVDTFKEPDLPGGIQVRQVFGEKHRLIVRPADSEDHKFVLVVGKAPRFRVAGWILGRDAMKPQWVDDPNGRPEAWFVPQSELRSMDEMDG